MVSPKGAHMQINRLDHLVLTVVNVEATCAWYSRVLAMEVVSFAGGRTALVWGEQKINLHQQGQEFEPKAAHPLAGSADLCFITSTPLNDVIAHLEANSVPIIEDPVQRTGALGPMLSIYIRDPDGNLIELSNYVHPTLGAV
jgi:catechol 2,3-dioxygenase-like lactoylglutathione lyase family enzyme